MKINDSTLPGYWLLCLVALYVGTGSSALVALPSDREQPIHISADSAIREDKLGITRYDGNVVLTQGSLVIHAERLIIQQNGGDATTITALGDPATLEQIPALDKAAITAQAREMIYTQRDELIQLKQGARIEQEGAILTGGLIDYLMAEQRVRAVSDKSDSKGRVEVVIPPSALQTSTPSS